MPNDEMIKFGDAPFKTPALRWGMEGKVMDTDIDSNILQLDSDREENYDFIYRVCGGNKYAS